MGVYGGVGCICVCVGGVCVVRVCGACVYVRVFHILLILDPKLKNLFVLLNFNLVCYFSVEQLNYKLYIIYHFLKRVSIISKSTKQQIFVRLQYPFNCSFLALSNIITHAK